MVLYLPCHRKSRHVNEKWHPWNCFEHCLADHRVANPQIPTKNPIREFVLVQKLLETNIVEQVYTGHDFPHHPVASTTWEPILGDCTVYFTSRISMTYSLPSTSTSLLTGPAAPITSCSVRRNSGTAPSIIWAEPHGRVYFSVLVCTGLPTINQFVSECKILRLW